MGEIYEFEEYNAGNLSYWPSMKTRRVVTLDLPLRVVEEIKK